jgi:hypothetical protein
MVEQWTHKPSVVGSNPTLVTTVNTGLMSSIDYVSPVLGFFNLLENANPANCTIGHKPGD